MIATLVLASLLAFAPAQGKGPPPATPPAAQTCETRENVDRAAAQNNARAAEVLTGPQALELQRRIVETLRQDNFPVDTIVLYENPQYTTIVFLVAFHAGCVVASAPFPRDLLTQLRNGI